MDDLSKSLTQSGLTLALIPIFCCLILGIAVALLYRRQRKTEAKWRELLTDSRGESLERLLYDHLRERMELESEVAALRSALQQVSDRVQSAIRFVGLVRFDAFQDVTGNQSFALAVYDERGDGAVVSSIVGRNSCRVYCKPLQAGRSERDLSQEEQRAIREAKTPGLKPIVSP